MRGVDIRKEYDFSRSRRNPYIRKLKKAISIRIDPDTIDYFKKLAEETGIPYQNLMNHYLADCASKGLKPSLVCRKRVANSLPVEAFVGLCETTVSVPVREQS